MVRVVSDSTSERTYDVEQADAMEASARYGRAESGEIVEIIDADGCCVSRAYWDDQYSKYRKSQLYAADFAGIAR